MIAFEPRHIPNIISVFRILLVYPVVQVMINRHYHAALALFILAGVSDGLDGFLARHFNWRSQLGSLLDPIADKLLLLSCFIVAGWQGLLPVWLVVAVILRDIVIVLGATLYYLLLRPFEGRPHWISKLNTFLQLLLIAGMLFHQGIAKLPVGLMQAIIGATLVTTVLSGLLYVRVWGASFRREIRLKR